MDCRLRLVGHAQECLVTRTRLKQWLHPMSLSGKNSGQGTRKLKWETNAKINRESDKVVGDPGKRKLDEEFGGSQE